MAPGSSFLFRNLDRIYKHPEIVRLRLGLFTPYLVNDPAMIQEVLVTKQQSFIKGRYLQNAKKVFGEGLLTSEGSFHHRQRRLVMPSFHHGRIGAYAGIITDYQRRQARTWNEGQVLDIHKEMMKLTMPIITKCLFDKDVETETSSISRDLTDVVEYLNRLSSPLAAILEKLPSNRKYEQAADRVDALVREIIAERRRSPGDRGDLLSALLDATGEDGKGMGDSQIRDEVFIAFAAGHETTAIALTWTWYLLSQNSDAEEKLHSEVDSVLAGRKTLTADDVPKLDFARKVLTEAMRIYPPAWIIGRQALEDVTIGGYHVPKGSDVLTSQYVMHHDPRYFQQPEAFMPDRWTEEMAKSLPRFAYFPFGGGARSCVGEPFAWMEGVLLLAAISRRWRMHWVGGKKAELMPRITLRPKGGMMMRLERRAQSPSS